ncbi:VOC family protein [Naasia aerilata]|uniref:Glyoxalase n=1 Tax=Naasia aerilata TaxID=1162966 RepID=A0ABM8GAH9_9MICO|nr:VOC family protein [Naasia aerilata]BDZ45203.1 glyoxalase [Naasia aerilata]
MAVRRIDHLGITVADLEAAVAFFVALGLRADSPMTVAGDWVGRVNGVPGSSVEMVPIRMPGGDTWLEVSRFLKPAGGEQAGAAAITRPGLRHFALVVDDVRAAVEAVRELGYDLVREIVDYEGVYLVCYVRGPEGILVELAQELDGSRS